MPLTVDALGRYTEASVAAPAAQFFPGGWWQNQHEPKMSPIQVARQEQQHGSALLWPTPARPLSAGLVASACLPDYLMLCPGRVVGL